MDGFRWIEVAGAAEKGSARIAGDVCAYELPEGVVYSEEDDVGRASASGANAPGGMGLRPGEGTCALDRWGSSGKRLRDGDARRPSPGDA
jgi:hypothetical protein